MRGSHHPCMHGVSQVYTPAVSIMRGSHHPFPQCQGLEKNRPILPIFAAMMGKSAYFFTNKKSAHEQ
ncbi:unnamed protein product [Staurois parvus]|uniref:Uncharacterized protein n=1 Tax=Staurois parvus TaxID=386267 RepID=A0ABN9CTP6_9NEOB|nr:unnamed protein product [Staurois parvus]